MLALRTGMKDIKCVAYSDDGTRLAVGGSALEVWAIPEYEPVIRWNEAGTRQLVFSLADSKRLLSVDLFASYYYVRDINTGSKKRLHFPGSHYDPKVYFLIKQRLAVVSDEEGLSYCELFNTSSDPTMYEPRIIWRLSGLQQDDCYVALPCRDLLLQVCTRQTETITRPRMIWGQPQPQRQVTAHINELVLRKLSTGETIFSKRTSYGHFDEWIASPDEQHLAARVGKTLLVWNAERIKDLPRRLDTGTNRQLTGIAFHPSSRWLATASNDSQIKIWDVETWQVVHSYQWGAGRMRSIAFAPDGLTAAAGGDRGEFVVFDVDL